MTLRRVIGLLAAAALLSSARPAGSGPQVLALFPPENLAGATAAPLIPLVAQSLAEKLSDRFDVRLANPAGGEDQAMRRRRARALGATYVVAGAVSRIGKTVTLDLSIGPVEDAAGGRTVVANATEEEPGTTSGKEIPPAYRKVVIEASARLKYLFFGDETVGEGAARRKIPKLAGTVTRSSPVPGDVVSIAFGDLDGDGVPEVIAAMPEEVVLYRTGGEELAVKARIPFVDGGVIRVEAADIDRDGRAEILVVRYRAGRALSEIGRYDGKEYRRIAGDLPYFLRAVDFGVAGGIVLAGQDSSAARVFEGPVFRVEWQRTADGVACRRGASVKLPPGTNLYGFVPMRGRGSMAFATMGDKGRLRLADGEGRVVWEGIDGIGESETALDAPTGGGLAESAHLFLPGRLLATDLDGDGNDEVIAVNNLAGAGAFFDGIRVFVNAEVLCFARDGEGLRVAWRSQQLGTSARDAYVEVTPAGRLTRVGIASRERGKIFDRLGEWRLVWIR